MRRFWFITVAAFCTAQASAGCTGDSNHSCAATLGCGSCGLGVCLTSVCTKADYEVRYVGCTDGKCNYVCHCKTPLPPPSPSPPSPPAPPSPPSPTPSGTPWYIAHAGPYKVVKHESIQLSSPKGGAVIVYPASALDNTSDNTFPFVSFAHGGAAGGGLTYFNYAAQMEVIASYGFIVVGTEVNEEGTPPIYSVQQRDVIKTCKASPSLHPALSKADFTRTSVAGHSMGGIATRQSLASEEAASLNIRAGWCSHPCSGGDDSKIRVPVLYTTGTSEPGPGFIGCPAPIAESSYSEAVNAKSRILFNVRGADHLDPMFDCKLPNHCRELIPGALFLSCHVKGVSSDCDKIYGPSGKEVCSLGTDLPYPRSYQLAECKVDGSAINATVVV